MEAERKIYYIGNSRIEIVPPQITEEERKERLEEIGRICWYVWMSLSDVKKQDIIRKYNTDKEG